MSHPISEKIDTLFSESQSTIAKDLKLNVKRLLDDSSLTSEEGALALIATASASRFPRLLEVSLEAGAALGLTQEVLREARENAAIMAMLNVYYRSRHFLEHADPGMKDTLGPAKLRMTSLANPAMGKQSFEMLAYAVSCINGCEMCVSSHEKALTALGTERDKIHDLTRLAASVFGLSRLESM